MNDSCIHVLLVEDNPGDAQLVREALAGTSEPAYRLEAVDHLSAGLTRLNHGGIDVVLLDLGLPDSQGLEGLTKFLAQAPAVPVVVLSGTEDERFALAAVQTGAQDYLAKAYLTHHALVRALRYAIERARAAEALRESERRERARAAQLEVSEKKFRNLYESMNDAYVQIDLAGHPCEFNQVYEQMLGYSREELLKLTYQNLTVAKWHAFEEKIVREQVLARGYSDMYEKEYRRKDGTIFPVELRTALLRDEAGRPAGRWAIVRDITERKRAEQAMLESERRERTRTADLLALMDAAPVAIFMAHDPECRQMSGNRFMTDVFRLPPGASPSVVLPDGRKQNYKLMRNGVEIPVDELPVRKAARTGRPVRNYEMDLVLDNGVSVNLLGDAVPVVDDTGHPRGAVGVFVDITERKRADGALRESNRKLQQLSRDLLRTQDYERRRIARELHDSTSQLLAALNMILSRLRDPRLAADRRSQMLSEASELAAACSTEIRTVTYLLHPPLLEEVGLTAALQAYATGFNQRTGIEVEVKIPPDFGRLGSERESTLFRILQEGLANVQKHSGSPSAVIRLERDSHEARLILQDYGRGFPTTLQEPATGFVRFGVGIMGMRERAEQLGGRVEFTSSSEGTRLTVILPLVQSNEEDANSFS